VSALAGLVAVTLADSGVVPLQLMKSVHQLQTKVNRLMKYFSQIIPKDTIGNWFVCCITLSHCQVRINQKISVYS